MHRMSCRHRQSRGLPTANAGEAGRDAYSTELNRRNKRQSANSIYSIPQNPFVYSARFSSAAAGAFSAGVRTATLTSIPEIQS